MIRLFAAPLAADGHREAHALLGRAYTAWTGLAAPEICKTRTGKPFLPGTGLECSLSHTRTLVVCALSDEGPVGVDAETLRPMRGGIEQRILTAEEQTWLLRQPVRDTGILTLWTRKEAWCKLTGKGLNGQPQRVNSANDHARFFSYCTRGCLITLCTCSQSAVPPYPEW